MPYRQIKYVVIDNGMVEQPYMFTGLSQHADVARKLGGKAVSAGFVGTEKNAQGTLHLICYGESISLGLKSRPEDANLLNECLFGRDWAD